MPFEYFILPGILAFILGIYKGRKSSDDDHAK